jgi:hypothetical protein
MKKILFGSLVVWCAAATAQLPTYVPTNGLIAWWSFNGNTNDDSGNNNNGTNNGATLTTDRFGNTNSAYSFDGSASYISIPTSASLESPVTRLTMSAWINLSGYSLVGQAFGPILTKSNSSANAFMYRFTVDINGISFYAGINNWTSNTGAAFNFSLNQWYLLTAVLDSSASYFYLNDSLVATNNFTTSIVNNTLPLEIGRDDPGSTEVFNGKIDDIGIWNVALTEQQITNLYLGPTLSVNVQASESSVQVYPNPATNEVNINFVNAGNEAARLTLYNSIGSIVKNFAVSKSELNFSVADLPEGIYFLKAIVDRKKVLFEKIIVIK